MLFGKKCFYCSNKLPKGKEVIEKEVKVYGKVGTFRKAFCDENHAKSFESFTEELFKRRKVCLPCGLS